MTGRDARELAEHTLRNVEFALAMKSTNDPEVMHSKFRPIAMEQFDAAEKLAHAYLSLLSRIEKLEAVAAAARATPIVEGWNEDRCNDTEYRQLKAAQQQLEDALRALDGDGNG